MKTSEFIKRVEKLGYKTVKIDSYIIVYDPDNMDERVGAVNIYCERQLSIYDAIYDLTKLLIEYAETPLDERETEKKYYVKVFNNFEGFLYVYADCVMLSARVDDSRGQFTQKDIDELKQRYDIPLDWDKVKLIEVEDDEND